MLFDVLEEELDLDKLYIENACDRFIYECATDAVFMESGIAINNGEGVLNRNPVHR